MYYRFRNGAFIEATTFEEAKAKLIAKIQAEEENLVRWHKCKCTGFDHSYGCPEKDKEPIPF